MRRFQPRQSASKQTSESSCWPGIKPLWSQATIRGVQQVVTCPGRKVDPGPLPRKEYTFTDASPVNIRLSLLMLNDIALSGVSGEVITRIGEHLKKASPFANTIMVTHADGTVGYIPDDSSYPRQTFEVLSSPFQAGCTEPSIVNGLIGMMKSYADQTH